MVNQLDDLDDEDAQTSTHNISKKKILLFLVPVLVVIGLAVGAFYTFSNNIKDSTTPYGVVKKPNTDGKGGESVTVFYDLPEVNIRLKNDGGQGNVLKMRVSLELSSIEEAKVIESLTPKLVDSIISHTIELNNAEIEGASNLYWLKEELLYRINLITSPIKITNLNFKNFEVQNGTQVEGKSESKNEVTKDKNGG